MKYIVVSTITDDVKTYADYKDMLEDIQSRPAYSYRVVVYANNVYQQLVYRNRRYA